MIESLEVMDRFSSSDHNMISWYVPFGAREETKDLPRIDYARADVGSIRAGLEDTDWDLLMCDGDAENCWNVFRNILLQLEKEIYPGKKEEVQE